MSKSTKIALIIVGLFVVVFIIGLFLFISILFGEREDMLPTTGKRLAIVELNEPIISSESVVRQFKRYRENRSIRGIVFRIDSPGGGVAASQEIFEEVKKTKEAGKPVVVSIGAVAASGGYYVACPATRIVANPGSVTGSIGVIMQFLTVEGLMNKVGVSSSTYKSGPLKDAGSPFRRPTKQESEYFQALIGDVYEQFVNAVAENRNLPRRTVLRYADGRVFSGKQALQFGFVDTLGTYEDAIGIAAELAGIEGKPELYKERKRRSWAEEFFWSSFAGMTSAANEFFRQPFLQYRFQQP